MGGCLSKGDERGRVNSEEIERGLDEDSKRLKRECKILLLGQSLPALPTAPSSPLPPRLRRVRQEHRRQADENHPPGWLYNRPAPRIPPHRLSQCRRVCPICRHLHAQNRRRMSRNNKQGIVFARSLHPATPLLIPPPSFSSRRSSTIIQKHTADPKSISLQRSQKQYTSSSRTPSSQRSSRII